MYFLSPYLGPCHADDFDTQYYDLWKLQQQIDNI